jgi:peptidoglycan hydrolase-like protein with peptidoglycan-binding domain
MTGTPFIPEYITVHLGRPDDASAPNVQVPFPDYIKNVASSEIYPTWPESAIRANVLAQISYALNRIYTEWYPSRGYDFDITSTTAYDQAYVDGRNIFENISRIVDDVFNNYVRKQGSVEPYFTQYCSGDGVTCPGLEQWGTVELAEQGMNSVEILKHYYGDDIEIVTNAPVMINTPSYPLSPIREGDSNDDVRTIQVRLNRISDNYPSIPKIPNIDGVFGSETTAAVKEFQRIFNLAADGVVGKSTWYKLAYIYSSVKKLGELASEGVSYEEARQQYPSVLQFGDSGRYVAQMQYFLSLISQFYDNIPVMTVTGEFDQATKDAVEAFQLMQGLPVDGIVGRNTWNEMYNTYKSVVATIPQSDYSAPFPGRFLKIGSTGDDVRQLQTYLTLISQNDPAIPAVTVDGSFGPQTEAAVRAFQEQHGLNTNGIVGPITWNAIAAAYDEYYSGITRNSGQYPGYVLRQE